MLDFLVGLASLAMVFGPAILAHYTYNMKDDRDI
jgi:hypothetical protein